MTKKVALYLRVSSDQQDAARQEKDLRDWADRAGHQVAGVYEDSISGTKSSRPGLDRLMKDVRRHKVKFIAVTELSRLARDMRDLLNMVHELQEHNCDLWIGDEALDTSTTMGKVFFQITGMFAEFERNLLADRTRSELSKIKDKIAQDGQYRSKGGNIITRLGRPGIEAEQHAEIETLLQEGQLSLRAIARQVGVSDGTVRRIKAQTAAKAA